MYKTVFKFRDGTDVVFKYEDYYKARETLLLHITGLSEDLLYAAVSYHGGEYTYIIDLADWRFECYGEVVSLGKLVSIISKDKPSKLLYGRIEEINALDGMIRIAVFDSNIGDTWISIEKFV